MKKLKKHPELKEDEYFIGFYTAEDYLKIGWKTKRAGFTEDSGIPVFVRRDEIKNAFGRQIESFFAGLSKEEKRINGLIVFKR